MCDHTTSCLHWRFFTILRSYNGSDTPGTNWHPETTTFTASDYRLCFDFCGKTLLKQLPVKSNHAKLTQPNNCPHITTKQTSEDRLVSRLARERSRAQGWTLASDTAVWHILEESHATSVTNNVSETNNADAWRKEWHNWKRGANEGSDEGQYRLSLLCMCWPLEALKRLSNCVVSADLQTLWSSSFFCFLTRSLLHACLCTTPHFFLLLSNEPSLTGMCKICRIEEVAFPFYSKKGVR